jgi:cytidyltransferase-like protein
MEQKYGLYLGRFQPFHDGHGSIVTQAWLHCDKLIIGIGSAQERRTKRNPLSYDERAALIYVLTLFSKDIKIIPIFDRDEYADNASWGNYVLDQVEKIMGVRPTVVFEGTEETHEHWWDDAGVEVVKIDRNETPISATQIRQMLLDDDRDGFTNNMPAGTWGFYDELREIMLEVYSDERV